MFAEWETRQTRAPHLFLWQFTGLPNVRLFRIGILCLPSEKLVKLARRIYSFGNSPDCQMCGCFASSIIGQGGVLRCGGATLRIAILLFLPGYLR